MKAAVLGAGNVGTALAADMALRGHDVALIKTSSGTREEHFSSLCGSGVVSLSENGAVRRALIPCVTRELGAVRGREVVIVCTRTDFHEALIRRIAPFLSAGQILLFVPGYLSTAYVLRHVNADVICAEAQSSFIDCRIARPGEIRVGFRNVRNPIGVFPQNRAEEAAALLDRLGFPFTYCGSVAEAALHNPNMIVHPVGALMSLPRMEKTRGDYCMYHEVFTPSVWRMLEALDGEKTAILAALGLPPLSYVDACKFRKSLDDTADGKAVFFAYAAMPTRAKGPLTAEDRYITEDVPQGLVLLESLGRHLGVATPVCTALIELASAALGRDLRQNGRTLSRLGAENVEKIRRDQTGGVK